jgi:RNA polymerase sigma-70 factor (ECF subfamily)
MPTHKKIADWRTRFVLDYDVMTELEQNPKLLQSFRKGEPMALTQVYHTYADIVFSFLAKGFTSRGSETGFSFGGFRNHFDLETMAQDIFVRAFSESARLAYDGLRPYRNYLMTIARNLVIDHLRKTSREANALQQMTDMAVLDPQPTASQNPQHEAEQRELVQKVDDLVNAMPGLQQEIFQWRIRKGMSVETCAKKLKISEYRVKRSEKDIRRRLFQSLQQQGYFRGRTSPLVLLLMGVA